MMLKSSSVLTILTLTIVFVTLVSANCKNDNVTVAINSLNVHLFQQLSTQDSKSNQFYSPTSISIAFAILTAGSAKRTRSQLQLALHIEDIDKVNVQYGRLITDLNAKKSLPKNETYELGLANRVLIEQTFKINATYRDRIVKNQFKSTILDVDFAKNGQQVVDNLNQWVSNETRGLIPKVFNEPLPTSTKLVIANAIYFKGLWVLPFNKTDTKNGTFNGLQRKNNRVPFMYRKGSYRTSTIDSLKATAIEIPYVGNASMVILLPNKDTQLSTMISSLTKKSFNDTINALLKNQPSTIELYLPKFNLTTQYNLVEIFKGLNVTDVFDPIKSNLTRIAPSDQSGNLFVSSAIHRAVVRVDEEGTEAAAVTAIGVGTTSVQPVPRVVRIDRPFLFVILDKLNCLQLFAGQVVQL